MLHGMNRKEKTLIVVLFIFYQHKNLQISGVFFGTSELEKTTFLDVHI